MEKQNPGDKTRTLVRVVPTVITVLLGLALTLTIVAAQASNFDSSYKTGPDFAETGEVIIYTIVTVNEGESVTNVLLQDPIPYDTIYVPDSCVYYRPFGRYRDCTPPDLWREDFDTGDRITTTFAVTVTAGSMGWPLENCATLFWDGNEKELCHTTTVNSACPYCVYLPHVMRNLPLIPDLRIVAMTIEPANPAAGQDVVITIEVQNVGGADAGSFWVDFYDNPDPLPTNANQGFSDLCAGAPADCYGIAWYVSGGLGAGQSMTLDSLTGYSGKHSRWPGYFVASGIHDTYSFVDVWNGPLWYGGVLERLEGLDNRYGPVFVNVGPEEGGWPVERIELDDWIPERPKP